MINGKTRVLATLIAISVGRISASAGDITQITDALRAIDCYRASVDYSVSLPQAQDDVCYDIALESMHPSQTDTLSPVNYVIDWTFRAATGVNVSGFSAYYDGHHYRFRGDRLQEYHIDWDAQPFATRHQGGRSFPGVQRGVQFANLLPAFIAMDLEEMSADSLYTISFPQSSPSQIKVRAVMTVQGVECLESVYTFSLPDMRPLTVSTETNVGTISEQSMRAVYSYDDIPTGPCAPISEQSLASRWPEVFEKYRESNFRIENLPGMPFPAFSLPQPGGTRLTRARGQEFGTPAIIVLIDPANGFASETVKAVRKGVDLMAYEPEVLWAVASTNPDTATSLIGNIRSGEAIALNAASLARDCGAASLPVIVMCSADGKVRDVILGYNNDLPSAVMQKMSMIK